MIINNEKFDVEKMHTRLGSSVDAENLLNLFSQLGFDVSSDVNIRVCVNIDIYNLHP